MPEELTPDEKERAAKVIALLASGDVSDEAQAKFEKLLTPKLLRHFGRAILAASQSQASEEKSAASRQRTKTKNRLAGSLGLNIIDPE
jgi:hypothetical protein